MLKRATPAHYVCQVLLAVIFILAVIYFFKDSSKVDSLWALGVSSLASSAFLMFTRPLSADLSERRFLLSYVINIGIGLVAHIALHHVFPDKAYMNHAGSFFLFSLVVALALGLSIVLMLLFESKHPPAIGICLILIIDLERYQLMTVIIGGVIVLSVLHHILRPWLRNL